MAYWTQKDFDGKTSLERLERACEYSTYGHGFSGEDFDLAKQEALKALAEGTKMSGELLVQVALFRSRGMLDFLLDEAKVDINTRDDVNATLLHHFVRRSSYIDVVMAIERGADVEAVKNDGSRPLHMAMKWPDIQGVIADTLLKNKADPNAKDDDGNTPLHYLNFGFDFNGQADTILSKAKLLIQSRADVNAQNNIDCTPLHLAADLVNRFMTSAWKDKEEKPEVYKKIVGELFSIPKFLIENGANINVADKQGRKPRDLLSDTFHKEWDAMVEMAAVPSRINPESTRIKDSEGPEKQSKKMTNG